MRVARLVSVLIAAALVLSLGACGMQMHGDDPDASADELGSTTTTDSEDLADAGFEGLAFSDVGVYTSKSIGLTSLRVTVRGTVQNASAKGVASSSFPKLECDGIGYVAEIGTQQLAPGERITATIAMSSIDSDDNLFMCTRSGIIKKTPIRDYANVRKTGLIAMNLKDDDELIEVKKTNSKNEILLITKYGQCIRFRETDVRNTGRSSMGVRGINLSDGDEVVAMQLTSQGHYLLIVSSRGLGKLTSVGEFTVQNRGGKGVKCYKITEKTGNVTGAKVVNKDNEIIMITTEGIIIRLHCSDISILGRITSGVKLINLDENVKVAGIAKVREKKEEPASSEGEEEEKNAEPETAPEETEADTKEDE